MPSPIALEFDRIADPGSETNGDRSSLEWRASLSLDSILLILACIEHLMLANIMWCKMQGKVPWLGSINGKLSYYNIRPPEFNHLIMRHN